MINLIGLGNTGSKLVSLLSKYPQYNTLTLDVGSDFKEYSTPEEYEEKCPSFKKKFKNIKGEVFLFLSASGKISGSTLRILEQLKGNVVNVVCIHSDPVTLSSVGNLQQNVVSNVLQEYARSGLIQNLYLISNEKIEDLLEDVCLDEYWQKINEIIVYIFHTFMYFFHEEPMMQAGEQENKISTIKTFGMIDSQGNKKILHDLKHITAETYFYSYSKEEDGKNKNYLKNIKTNIANQQGDAVRSFKIFQNFSKDKNTYVEYSTHILQYTREENK